MGSLKLTSSLVPTWSDASGSSPQSTFGPRSNALLVYSGAVGLSCRYFRVESHRQWRQQPDQACYTIKSILDPLILKHLWPPRLPRCSHPYGGSLLQDTCKMGRGNRPTSPRAMEGVARDLIFLKITNHTTMLLQDQNDASPPSFIYSPMLLNSNLEPWATLPSRRVDMSFVIAKSRDSALKFVNGAVLRRNDRSPW